MPCRGPAAQPLPPLPHDRPVDGERADSGGHAGGPIGVSGGVPGGIGVAGFHRPIMSLRQDSVPYQASKKMFSPAGLSRTRWPWSIQPLIAPLVGPASSRKKRPDGLAPKKW
jgi:hypothetical protein